MSTQQHSTISEMMEHHSAEAVRLAPDFDVHLDYSEASLQKLEDILTQLCATLPSSGNTAGSASKNPAQERLDTTSRVWGAYFGETIRRLWDGEWGVETYPGTVAPVISIDIGGAKIFPVMKIYRRLTRGDGENVWKFYQMIREKLGTGKKQ